MSATLMKRLMTEPDKRLLWKFAYNFGYKGMRSIERFQKRLKQGEYFPAFLFISVTNACNLACQGCWVSQSNPPKEIAPGTLDNLITECKKQGSYFFGILGGEPLLYDGLFEVFEKHPECYFLLFTNGMMITDAVAKEMRRIGNISPLISIEGLEEVSDVRRGGESVYQQSMMGLANCTRNRLVTGVCTSVCKSNIDDLANEKFVNEVARLGAHYLWYYIYRPVGPNPTPSLALNSEQVTDLRRFMVDVRRKAPIMVVDAYWDDQGAALCPAAVGIANHISPDGYIEPCPPLQFAKDNIGDGTGLYDIFNNSEFLAKFRSMCTATTQGCIIMEHPGKLAEFIESEDATDSSGRGTLLQELGCMGSCGSHHQPGKEIPERSWAYRFAKKHWFFGFGAYG
ncbi:Sporulation killing factor maturation protein SkfB [Pontiella desulfatans]|uniref:Sporulation killing factor maturation protein SkfB n=1 Tax=Pontiella desulfatans TaxID=2750659 RepID=A0A6C2UCD8_PONDE|nr:radical SAM/SPASM domain-containing protein [Pontiella desulfatans]VGO17513.1 Sporulation killing factor maturation protein SkfB [Pontiella desulfatans]